MMSSGKKYLYTVDRSKPVLVTGATGYIAGVLIRELLDEGVIVHATVRDPSKKDRFQYLQDLADKRLGSIKFFKGDLLEEGSFEEAMSGCSIVFHTASPFTTTVEDAVKDLIEPAVHGTENVLSTANNTPSVKRVVLTSSVVAIYNDAADTYNAPGNVLTEEIWNRTATVDYQPYNLSKTLAEQKAWVMAGSQTQWKLVVINPSFVLGPGVKYHATSTSHDIMTKFGDGTMAKGCPNICMGVVDVREVAHAHVAAAYIENASGRHILSGYNTAFPELAEALVKKYPDYPIPTRRVPRTLIYLLAPWLNGGMSRSYVWKNIDVPINLDHSKSEKELGIVYRPLEDTVQEMFQQLIDEGVIKKE